MLAALIRGMALVGALSAAFGPSYAYTVLRLAYGQRWSATEAPSALAAYSLYIPLLAVNGILEVLSPSRRRVGHQRCCMLHAGVDWEHSAGGCAGICACCGRQQSAVPDQCGPDCVRGYPCRSQPRARPRCRSRGCVCGIHSCVAPDGHSVVLEHAARCAQVSSPQTASTWPSALPIPGASSPCRRSRPKCQISFAQQCQRTSAPSA